MIDLYFHFQSGKFRKNERKSNMSQEISLKKKLLVNKVSGNFIFPKLQVIFEKESF